MKFVAFTCLLISFFTCKIGLGQRLFKAPEQSVDFARCNNGTFVFLSAKGELLLYDSLGNQLALYTGNPYDLSDFSFETPMLFMGHAAFAQRLLFFNRFLQCQAESDLQDLGSIACASMASQGSCVWLFDTQAYRLLQYDAANKLLLQEQSLEALSNYKELSFSKLEEHQGLLLAFEPEQGLFVFSNTLQLKRNIACENKCKGFKADASFVYLLYQEKLLQYALYEDNAPVEIALPANTKQCYLSQGKLYLLREGYIERISF